MTSLSELVGSRGAIRGQLTKLESELKAACDSLNKNDAEVALVKLRSRKTKLETLNKGVLTHLATEDEFEAEVDGCEKYDDICTEWETRLTQIINEAKRKEAANNPSPQAPVTQSRQDASVAALASQLQEGLTLRLPQFQMTKFGGEIHKWPAFWSSFSSAIHNKPGFSAIDKFNYLVSVLTGSASKCIEGFPITEENYEIVVDRLQQRFGRPKQIINGIMTSFERLVAPKNEIVSLRKFLDEIEVKSLNLKSLGVDLDACSALLVPMVVKLLPRELMLAWIRLTKKSKEEGLNQLIEFLSSEIELREEMPLEVAKKEAEGLKKEQSSRASASTSALNVTVRNADKPLKCMICDSEDHRTMMCIIESVSERVEKLRELKKCFNCFWTNHSTKECRKDRAICRHCNGSHHTALCYKAERDRKTVSNTEEEDSSAEVSVNQVINESTDDNVLLGSAVVTVNGDKAQVSTRLMIDGGSQRSFISKRLSKLVGAVPVGSEVMSVNVFDSATSKTKEYRRVRVTLYDHEQSRSVEVVLCEADSVSPTYSLMPSKWIEQSMKQRKLTLADPGRKIRCDVDSVDILIGGDLYWSVITGKVERLNERLAAVESVFGWMVIGPDEHRKTNVNCMNVSVMHVHVSDNRSSIKSADDELNEQVSKFWEIESLGISPEEAEEKKENEVKQQLYKTIKKENDRYCVQLPWNERKSELQSNMGAALKRFYLSVRRLCKDEELIKRYHSAMVDYLNSEHSEIVDNPHESVGVLYYIPHQAVVRMNHDTMKLRVVFDASSGQPSLNDCLHAGPHLNPDILELLLRFRQHAVAVTADMEKAFLQVAIDPNDRDATRYIWLPENWKPGDPIEPKIYRMKRVLFGLNSGPFLLAATIQYHLETTESVDSEVIDEIDNNVYVDDLVKSVESDLKGWLLYREGKRIFAEAGFNLRKWATNSKELREAIAENEREDGQKDEFSDKSQEEEIKVLGMKWNQWRDVLKFDTSELNEFLSDQPPTKRIVLRAMARIFDPMGLVSPYTIRLKCMFQQLCKLKMSWDDPISEQYFDQWNKWLQELEHLNLCKIPRCIATWTKEEVTKRELHAFSDASEKIFGAVIYMVEFREDEMSSRIIASRNKVAPLKAVSIPRLELLGVLICARLVSKVIKAMKLDDVTLRCWTDSMAVLHWIRGDSNRWKVYVANRIKEVKRLTDPSCWNHVRTKENPADKITRGMPADELVNDDRWWKGPTWLSDEVIETIIEDASCLDDEEVSRELKRKTEQVMMVTVEEPLWDTSRFSRWSRLIRMMGWMRRFVYNCRNRIKKTGELDVNELKEAEAAVLKHEQKQMYPVEYEKLEGGASITTSSKLSKFDPKFGEDGLIRLGGRLQFSMLDHSTKHPIILDGDHLSTKLIVKDCHKRVMHGGVSETMAEVREKYWIPSARTKVKSTLKHCIYCAKRRVKSATAVEAPLPADRVEMTHPFEVTGIDYAGPIYIKEGKTGQRKCYILLFTCAVTRAIHLESVLSMNADDFLLAFRRFLARRGPCRTLWSDNAKTFKRAERDQQIWNKMMSFAQEKEIEWKYIVERAPWWGGIWERMVRSTKDKLKTICGRAMLTFEEFRTMLIEAESIINSRPLTYVPDETKEILTPAHFLVGRRLTAIPPDSKLAEQLGGSIDVGKRWRHRLVIMNRLWKSWRNDYLLTLRTAHERRNVGSNEQLKVGQPVLLDDERTVRHLWKVCVIKELFKGRDGQVRSCLLKLSNGKEVKRPIQLLYPLEQ